MRLPHDIDAGAGWRARLGLIVLHVDETIETEFRRLIDFDGVALHCTRIRSGAEVTPESLLEMEDRITAAASMLPPSTRLDAVGYACTSAAALIGPDRITDLVGAGRREDGGFADTPITNPLTAAVAAFRALGVRRIACVSPYTESVFTIVRQALESEGLEISAVGSFEQAEEYRVARIDAASVRDAIVRVGETAPCDAVFVSCTNLRTLDVLPAAEERLGLPVISSNQALAWHLLRQAGINDGRPSCGRLFG